MKIIRCLLAAGLVMMFNGQDAIRDDSESPPPASPVVIDDGPMTRISIQRGRCHRLHICRVFHKCCNTSCGFRCRFGEISTVRYVWLTFESFVI